MTSDRFFFDYIYISMSKVEDDSLRRVFAFTLDASKAAASEDLPIVYLADVSQELCAEQAKCVLCKDTLERSLVSRLSNPPLDHAKIWPIHYLIRSYGRAVDELRSVGLIKDEALRQVVIDTLQTAKQLIVSYSGLMLTTEGLFPQPEEANKRGALQLLDSLEVFYEQGISHTSMSSNNSVLTQIKCQTMVTPMPPGYLEDYAVRFEEEGLDEVVSIIAKHIMQRFEGMSLLAEYTTPLAVLERLFSVKSIAKALIGLPFWLPGPGQDGRSIEFQSFLGPVFGVSAMWDSAQHPMHASRRQPDTPMQLFAGLDLKSNRAEWRNRFQTVHTLLDGFHTRLSRIVLSLLKSTETRGGMLDWLAAALHTNHERAKLRPDPKKAASDGFMINISITMLHLCDPFIDPGGGKAWGKLDARYVSDPTSRLGLPPDETRLAADSDAVSKWSETFPPNINYHFICECFFLTARALHLGVKKSLDNSKNLNRSIDHLDEDMQEFMRSGDPRYMTLKAMKEKLQASAMAAECTLQLPSLLKSAGAYYQLLSAYLLRLASTTENGTCGAVHSHIPSLPLPLPPSNDFSNLPEHIVEDLCEILSLSAMSKQVSKLDDSMVFLTVFLGAPVHLRNPYLRGKMVEVLYRLVPPTPGSSSWSTGRQTNTDVAALFQIHPLVVDHLVKSLIQLYVDIEHTDRHNAFYEKFNIRYEIGELAGQLWNIPSHKESWRNVAREDERLYVRFINMMINDSQHLLQEALNTLPGVQEIERLQADPAAWNALPQQQRQERMSALAQHRRVLKSDFALAAVCIALMRFTSEDKVVAVRFFDSQVRDRQARILNFFLKYLTVPSERKRLKLKNPEDYGWRPKELIAQLAYIHINLYRADPQSWAAAVAADTDYLGAFPEMFAEVAALLRSLGLMSDLDIRDITELSSAVDAAKASVAAEEEAWGDDIPEEFEDPLSCRLMADPVKLPSGNVVDRRTILQHLLTDQRDPFSRAKMTEDDIEPLPELKAQIDAWVQEKREARLQE